MNRISWDDVRRHLPLQVPWSELSGVGKVRRVVFWLSMAGNVGLASSAMTSGSDLGIKADGTKRKKSEPKPEVSPPPQPEQAGEDPADEKRGEPEQQEGRADKASA